MALHYRTCGFVIKKKDNGEADRVFTIFSQDFGKIKVIGKAIRKIASKLKGGIDIFCLSEIEFIQGKAYKTLTDAIVLKKFKSIGENLIRLKVFHKISESFDLLRTEEKDEELWNLLNETLKKLEKDSLLTEEYLLIYYYFLWNLFFILGYKPELFHCVVCQKKLNPSNLYFSSDEGGVICSFCLNKAENIIKIDSDLVKILRLISEKDWKTIIKLKTQLFSSKLLKEVSEDYYSHLLSIHSFKDDF